MNWLPSVTSTALLAATLWLLRRVIAERLANTVRHEFDVKLEGVRAEIRKNEERVNAVRSTALSALSTGQTALNQRRLEAVDVLWSATSAMKQGTLVVGMWGALKRDRVAANRADPAIQQLLAFLESVGDQFVEGLKARNVSVDSARPYVTPMAWALYSAYSGVVVNAVLTVKALRLGVSLDVLKADFALTLVKTALPDAEPILSEFGEGALPMFMTDLEERLLAELRASIEGRDSDAESVARAKKVAELVAQHEVDQATKKSQG